MNENLFILFFLLFFGRSELLGVGQVVDGDGQEDVEKSVIAEQHEDDKVQGINHSPSRAALGLDALVHDFVPILTRQYLIPKESYCLLSNYKQ